MGYRVISADDHVQELPETWVDRVPARFKDRVPRLVPGPDGGDAWVIDGDLHGGLGLDVSAGLRFEEYVATGDSLKRIRPGGYDPGERLKDMDLDGVDGQVLFPNVGRKLFGVQDSELVSVSMRGYNDWLSEFCVTSPQRLVGVGLVPSDDIEDAVAEARHIATLPGMRGVLVSTFPHGRFLNDPYFDPLWATAQEAGLPVHIHTGQGNEPWPGRGSRPAAVTNTTVSHYQALSSILWSGILELFPKLQFVSVEANIGWIPYFLEKCEVVHRRHRFWSKTELPHPPSFYFKRQMYATFVEDRTGVAIREMIGVDNIMWSSDYPHSATTWPNSQEYLKDHFEGVPEEHRRKMTGGNAAGLYHLEG